MASCPSWFQLKYEGWNSSSYRFLSQQFTLTWIKCHSPPGNHHHGKFSDNPLWIKMSWLPFFFFPLRMKTTCLTRSLSWTICCVSEMLCPVSCTFYAVLWMLSILENTVIWDFASSWEIFQQSHFNHSGSNRCSNASWPSQNEWLFIAKH